MKISKIISDHQLGDFGEFYHATFQMAARLASGNDTDKTEWESVYCSENETNEWTEEEANQAFDNRVIDVTVDAPDGSYICVTVGAGWFAWGVGCPLASAIMEYWQEQEANK